MPDISINHSMSVHYSENNCTLHNKIIFILLTIYTKELHYKNIYTKSSS